ncbi:VWA domain-containing protein [Paraburkholderia sp. UCT31]|uniref:VWA domain-containing protein n=1 Tax=Paraburkholderia sp. UCT31 TaxID=2615209 RepID=UPI0016559F88|nr:VWA domain-containing protein [Paraburkholderia sp. UCT31]MBC8737123.1 VWA domain-containing protein [Paraburkholderia sp. UCT31]
MKKLFALLLTAASFLSLAACEQQAQQADPSSGAVAAAQAAPQDTLTCLSGSEVADVAPLLGQLQKETGVTLKLAPSGTLASVETLASNAGQYDCGWFSHNKYLLLNDAVKSQVKASERIMSSPVILGVKAEKAKALGWTADNTTWADVAKAAKAGAFTFAMTSPASSNTGMSALIGVTSALSGADSAITPASIQKVELSGFGKGQILFSDSSGWLTTAFVSSLSDPKGPDGMINYESELLKVNATKNANLTLIYPKEGIITADYPLMLFNPAKKAQFDKVVAFFKRDDIQKWLMENTYRRPVSPTVTPDAARFGTHLLVDVPFPGNAAVLDDLLISYLDKQRKPAHDYFVLDTSGSMGDNGGIEQLRNALVNLAGNDTSLSGRFSRFRLREKVTIIEFAGGIKSIQTFSMGENGQVMAETLKTFKDYASNLNAGGGTAIFGAVEKAYALAAADADKEPGYLQSIVVMTDGQSNEGPTPDDFAQFYNSPAASDMKHVRVFGVLFGSDADKTQIQGLATMTGGAVFDGSTSLSSVFKKIRGYQ